MTLLTNVRRVVCLNPQDDIELRRIVELELHAATKSEKFEPEIEILGRDQIGGLVANCRPFMLRDFPSGNEQSQQQIERYELQTSEYREQFKKVHNQIRFVGMSVYQEEATAAVPLDRLYIPLRFVAEDASTELTSGRTDPLELLKPESRNVILGGPGCGKSTLLKFLSLIGSSHSLQERFGQRADLRLPVLIVLRQYADELKARKHCSTLGIVGNFVARIVRGGVSSKSETAREWSSLRIACRGCSIPLSKTSAPWFHQNDWKKSSKITWITRNQESPIRQAKPSYSFSWYAKGLDC